MLSEEARVKKNSAIAAAMARKPLARACADAGSSLRAVAEAAGRAPSNLSKYAEGKATRPVPEHIRETVERLTGWDDWPPPRPAKKRGRKAAS
jgi:hypothetical protein